MVHVRPPSTLTAGACQQLPRTADARSAQREPCQPQRGCTSRPGAGRRRRRRERLAACDLDAPTEDLPPISDGGRDATDEQAVGFSRLSRPRWRGSRFVPPAADRLPRVHTRSPDFVRWFGESKSGNDDATPYTSLFGTRRWPPTSSTRRAAASRACAGLRAAPAADTSVGAARRAYARRARVGRRPRTPIVPDFLLAFSRYCQRGLPLPAPGSSSSPIAGRTTSSGRTARGSRARPPAGWSACSRRWRGGRAWPGSAASPSRPTPSRRARACTPPPPTRPTRACTWCPCRCPPTTYHAYYGQISNEVLWMLQHHVIGAAASSFSITRATRRGAATWRRTRAWPRRSRGRAAARAPSWCRTITCTHCPACCAVTFPDTPILHFTHIPFPDPPVLRLIPACVARDHPARHARRRRGRPADAAWTCARSWRAAPSSWTCAVDRGAARGAPARWTRRCACAPTRPASIRARCGGSMRSPEVAAAHERLAPERGELTIIRVDRLDPEQEPAGWLPGVRAPARDAAGPVRAGAISGVHGARRGPTWACIARTATRCTAPSRRSTRASAMPCGGPPIASSTPTIASRRWRRCSTCNVLLINSLQDGMNLVAKEWAVVASESRAC